MNIEFWKENNRIWRKTMNNYKLQLERLKRHYEQSINAYDLVSFLDLAHTLRIWTELKEAIQRDFPKSKFKKWILTKRLHSILNENNCIYAHLPDWVRTKAEVNKGQISYWPQWDEKFSISNIIKFEPDGSIYISQFTYIREALKQDRIGILNQESHNPQTALVCFSKYLDSPAIYYRFGSKSLNHISNEQLIKRVANEYEASHSENQLSNFEEKNIFSEPVKKIMQYWCSNLPLPYFILLHIAKNIITELEAPINDLQS